MKEYKKFFDIVEKEKNIVIYSHVDGDGDSNGSLFAMDSFLRKNYPDKKITVLGYDWKSDLSVFFKKKSRSQYKEKHLAIVLDTANLPRLDDPKKSFPNASSVVKIDHHPNDDDYGDVKIVDTSSSSTCEILYRLFTQSKKEINKEISQYLFIGILTDTGRFRYDNTTSNTFGVLSKLFEYKIETNEIYKVMLSQNLKDIKFRAYIQSNIKLKGDVAYFILPKNKEKKFGISNNQTSGYVYALSNIEGVTKWVYASYSNTKKLWKVSIRSNDKKINGIAKKYNGGGHDKASGASVNKKSEFKKLIEDLYNI